MSSRSLSCNIIINELNNEIENMFSKSLENTNLKEIANTFEDRIRIQILKLNGNKCKYDQEGNFQMQK